MLRSVAITRIQDGLGFATRQSDKIILRLQEAQRELEKGKTLPRFLLQENIPVSLVIGASSLVLPAGFLRVDDDGPFRYVNDAGGLTFIPFKRSFTDSFKAYYAEGESSAPTVAMVRNAFIDFINPTDKTYNLFWNYYKSAASLATDIENEWLLNAPEWLIGEAGWRMAMDARDKDATLLFDTMRKTGRAAAFGEIVASEEASGPLIMGAGL